jgi:hypothetical protein
MSLSNLARDNTQAKFFHVYAEGKVVLVLN